MSRPPTFLVADDEASMRGLLGRFLEGAFPGSSVVPVSDPDRVVETVSELRPDLVFLDWVFPGGRTGPSLCAWLKSQPSTRSIPVILMTGRRTGLENRCKTVRDGADLFLAKPFTREEAVSYARALLHRGRKTRSHARTDILRRGAMTLNLPQRAAWYRGRRIPRLTPKLFGLLWHLARFAPRAVPTSDLVRHVWGNAVRDKHVSLAVTRLRRSLKRIPALQVRPASHRRYRLEVA